MCESRDCFNCPYPDCIVDGLTREENIAACKRDGECLVHSPNYKARRKYEQTEKGKARQQRYEQSEKGKERKARYRNSPKGKAQIEAHKKQKSEYDRKRYLAKKQGVI